MLWGGDFVCVCVSVVFGVIILWLYAAGVVCSPVYVMGTPAQFETAIRARASVGEPPVLESMVRVLTYQM